MDKWTKITQGDLEDQKVAALVTALRTAALAEGQPDPTDATVRNVVTRIRSEVAGCEKNRLDADPDKIPNSLKSLAVRLVLVQMKNRLEIELTKDESKAWDKDERYLERIAECDVTVAAPDDPEPSSSVQQGGAAETISGRGRKLNDDNLDGL